MSDPHRTVNTNPVLSLWLDGKIPFHGNEVELATRAVGTDSRLVEVYDARQISPLAVVYDLKDRFAPDQLLPVRVRDNAAHRRGCPHDIHAVDVDLAIEIPARCSVLKRCPTGPGCRCFPRCRAERNVLDG